MRRKKFNARTLIDGSIYEKNYWWDDFLSWFYKKNHKINGFDTRENLPSLELALVQHQNLNFGFALGPSWTIFIFHKTG